MIYGKGGQPLTDIEVDAYLASCPPSDPAKTERIRQGFEALQKEADAILKPASSLSARAAAEQIAKRVGYVRGDSSAPFDCADIIESALAAKDAELRDVIENKLKPAHAEIRRAYKSISRQRERAEAAEADLERLKATLRLVREAISDGRLIPASSVVDTIQDAVDVALGWRDLATAEPCTADDAVVAKEAEIAGATHQTSD